MLIIRPLMKNNQWHPYCADATVLVWMSTESTLTTACIATDFKHIQTPCRPGRQINISSSISIDDQY